MAAVAGAQCHCYCPLSCYFVYVCVDVFVKCVSLTHSVQFQLTAILLGFLLTNYIPYVQPHSHSAYMHAEFHIPVVYKKQ